MISVNMNNIIYIYQLVEQFVVSTLFTSTL